MLVTAKIPQGHELLDAAILFPAYELLAVDPRYFRRSRTANIFDVGGYSDLRHVANPARERFNQAGPVSNPHMGCLDVPPIVCIRFLDEVVPCDFDCVIVVERPAQDPSHIDARSRRICFQWAGSVGID